MGEEYIIVAWKFYLALACVFSAGALLSGIVCWAVGWAQGYKRRDRDYWA